MTGTPKMDTRAYREYFAPLEKWLIKKNKEENNKVPRPEIWALRLKYKN